MAKYRFEQIAINSTEKKKPEENDRFTYLGLEHLDSDCLKVSRFGTEVAPVGEKLIMRKGDVLFGKRRAYQKKVAIAPFDGIFSAHGMVLRPREDVIDAQFFPFFISSDYFLDAAIKISVGSLSPTINWRDLKNLEFDLPAQPEQRKLATILQSMSDTIECYKTLLIKTDELVKSQFVEQMQIWHKLGQGKKVRMGDFTRICTGKLDANAASQEGRYPFFTCSRIPLRIDTYSYDCECVLVAGNGELNAKYYNGKFDAYQRTYIIQSKDKRLLSVPFLYRFLEQYVDTLQKQAIGGVIKYIKLGMLTNAELILPPVSLQIEFVHCARQIDKSKGELERALSELTLTYKRILAENLG